MFIDILIVTLVLPTPIGVACLLELLWNHKKIFRTIIVYDKILKINQLMFLKHTVFRKELKGIIEIKWTKRCRGILSVGIDCTIIAQIAQ